MGIEVEREFLVPARTGATPDLAIGGRSVACPVVAGRRGGGAARGRG